MTYTNSKLVVSTIILSLVLGIYAALVPGIVHAETAEEAFNKILQSLSDTNGGADLSSVTSQGFSRDGVYGCTGASYAPVGMQGPSGAHVPVFDDAVHDQIRLLTYKECVLDGIVNSMRETLISYLLKSVVDWVNSGFNGAPAYITNYNLYILEEVKDPAVENFLTQVVSQKVAEPFQSEVIYALAKKYQKDTRDVGSELECPLSTAQLQAYANNKWDAFGGWKSYDIMATNPACNKLLATFRAGGAMQSVENSEVSQADRYLNWGNGTLSQKTTQSVDLGDGKTANVERIVTPGFIIAEYLKQVIGTGMRQTENADEIDEIISALMSNIGTEMLTGINGFAGLSQALSGKSSYVNRVVSDSAARTRANMTNAGGSIVDNAINIESEYKSARAGSVSTLTSTRAQLESWERSCWSALIDQAKADLAEEVCDAVNSSSGSSSGSSGVGTTGSTVTRTGNYCGATVTVLPATDVINIRTTTTAGQISVSGRATKSNANISVIATDTNGTSTAPSTTSSGTNGSWSSVLLNLSALSDGDITVAATETSTSGTLSPITAIVQKKTGPDGVIELFTPLYDASVTITASANSSGSGMGFGTVTRSATLTPTITRSRAIADNQITPLIDAVKQHIANAVKALQVLSQLKAALSSTTSASAQRYILEQIDSLVTKQLLHTNAQLLAAREQDDDIENAMSNLLSDTKSEWEGGWCDPDNWDSYVL